MRTFVVGLVGVCLWFASGCKDVERTVQKAEAAAKSAVNDATDKELGKPVAEGPVGRPAGRPVAPPDRPPYAEPPLGQPAPVGPYTAGPGPVAPPVNAAPPVGPNAGHVGNETITIASFNIQVFGTSKLAKPEVMKVLVDVVRQFDIVAIQELRAKDQTVMEQFVAMINEAGRRYSYVAGPRLGRTNSKEQYVFVFDTQRIELNTQSAYTVPDPRDLLHREPFVAQFRARGVPPEQAFTFNLVNIHTDPDETVQELDALADVFTSVQHNPSGEDDVILLGDLNVSCKELGQLGRVPQIAWTINGEPTNTRLSKSYDNMIYHRVATTEFTGRCGVVNLMTAYSLTEEQALEVSDHLPIWAEFSAYEGGAGTVATRPTQPR